MSYKGAYRDSSGRVRPITAPVSQRGHKANMPSSARSPIPGIKPWTLYAGGTGVPDKYYGYGFESDIGKYSISPVGDSRGRMEGYRVLREWSPFDKDQRILNGYRLVRSPNEGVRVAREDYAERKKMKFKGTFTDTPPHIVPGEIVEP